MLYYRWCRRVFRPTPIVIFLRWSSNEWLIELPRNEVVTAREDLELPG